MSVEPEQSLSGRFKRLVRTLRPKQWSMFGLGVLGLLIVIDNLAFPLRDASEWDRYLQYGWYLFAAVFFYWAYRPAKLV